MARLIDIWRDDPNGRYETQKAVQSRPRSRAGSVCAAPEKMRSSLAFMAFIPKLKK
jgi:hypothetical protein